MVGTMSQALRPGVSSGAAQRSAALGSSRPRASPGRQSSGGRRVGSSRLTPRCTGSSSSSSSSSSRSNRVRGGSTAPVDRPRSEALSTKRSENDTAVAEWRSPDLFTVALGASIGLALLAPGHVSAAEAMVPVELFKDFLVILAEMIPLFPTQPLALAGGLLFGPLKGAGLVLTGNVGAAAAAFLLARGVGRTLAEKVIQMETEDEEGSEGNPILGYVEEAIENGSFSAQFASIFFLRLTPVVPFSASNYVLGLSTFPFVPFFGGTLLGMTPWALLFCSLGGAGRKLLDGGEDLGQVFADLTGRAGEYTEEAALVGVVLALAAAGVWGVKRLTDGQGEKEEQDSSSTRVSQQQVKVKARKEKVLAK